MRFDVILALTDFSSHENMAVQRACLLAAGHGARVRPDGMCPRAGRP
jgi:hypothetical protein